MRIYIFLAIVFLIFTFISIYIYRGFKKRFFNGTKNTKILILFLGFITFIFVLNIIIMAQNFSSHIFIFGINTVFAILLMIFFMLLVFDIIVILARFIMPKKDFTKTLNLAFLIMTTVYITFGFYGGLKEPKINEVDIYLENLSNPLKLAVLGDIHLNKTINKEFLSSLISKVNTAQSDALLIVGDMLDLKVDELNDTLLPLKNVNMPIFFVTGNHEFYHGANDLVDAIKEVGVRVLENESIEFKGINLVGVHDMTGLKFGYLKPDIDKAMSGTNKQIPTVLMAHQPRYAAKNLNDSVDLYISGHTHAGQIFPFSFFVWLQQKYVYGLYKTKNSQIYITSGAGFWGAAMRVFAPKEIAILNLKGKK